MPIFVPKESDSKETRIPLVPETVKKLTGLGADILVESGLGASLGYPDGVYESAGAKIAPDRKAGYSEADMVLRLRKPPVADVGMLKPGTIHVSYLDPFNDKEAIPALASAGVSAIAMEMIPRSTIAQKMDALSSQANLAGYMSVLLATQHMKKILPMMMTPSGTIKPSRVFIIGVGVAGLQAIATAKRLGARVDAFDTRPVVEEQVKSLGAKFVKVDLGETGQTKDGYAKALTEEQLARQRDAMAKVCAQSDVVITTAQVFGRKAPVIVTAPMVASMAPGSVIVDLAVESGGNVEGSKCGEVVEVNGVKIVGVENVPGLVPVNASQMYSSNLGNLVGHFWDKDGKQFVLNREDEIIQSALITFDKAIVNERIKGLF